jgi:hypothetical protein
MKRLSLETRLEKVYAKVPPLSESTRRWLGINAWWIVLVIVIISSLVTLNALRYLSSLSNLYTYQYSYNEVSPTTIVVATIVEFVFSVIALILLYRSISPLKQMRRLGWKLLFTVEIVNALSLIVSFIILIQRFDIFSLVWGLIIIAAELYLLFQIRQQFAGRSATAKEAHVLEPK